jgi:hypothetical protein
MWTEKHGQEIVGNSNGTAPLPSPNHPPLASPLTSPRWQPSPPAYPLPVVGMSSGDWDGRRREDRWLDFDG